MPIRTQPPREWRPELHKHKKKRRHEEETIQQATIHALRALGYRVQQTTHRVKLACCPKCFTKFHPKGNYGATKGISDLLVRSENWPKYFWVHIEMKGPKTPLSPEQKELAAADGIVIARSVDDAVEIMKEVELQFSQE